MLFYQLSRPIVPHSEFFLQPIEIIHFLRLKPLQDKVRKVEKELATERDRLADLDARLVDESIYTDASRKDELTQLVRDQAAARSTIETLEWEWLEASEELELANQAEEENS